MVHFLLKLLLKRGIFAVYHDFHFATKLTAKLYSRYVKESESRVGVGNFGKVRVRYFTSYSATLDDATFLRNRQKYWPHFVLHCDFP